MSFFTALTGLYILFRYDMSLNATKGFNIEDAVLFYACVDVKGTSGFS